jgi:hypothetical protein
MALVAGALVLLAALAPAARADRLYWANFDGPEPITYAELGGSAVNPLNIGGASTPEVPFGVAIDPVGGRLYWASSNGGKISYANLDGSGGGDLNTGAATVDLPTGVAVDVAARKIYWANQNANKISWANLDGSGGGDLKTGPATVQRPTGIAVDPPDGRVYWTNGTLAGSIAYASLDGSGGADVPIAGTATLEYPLGIAIDRAAGRMYWTSDLGAGKISYANLDGSGSADLNTKGATAVGPYGVAVDPEAGRAYWGNPSDGSMAFARLDGTGGADLPFAIPEGSAPNFPVIYDTPRAIAAPVLSRRPLVFYGGAGKGAVKAPRYPAGANLSCTQGIWAGDLVESFLYRAPLSVAVQWTREGQDVAAGTDFAASGVGDYRCRATATNWAGSTSQLGRVAAVFDVGKSKLNRRRGTARLSVALPGNPGSLALTGKGVVQKVVTASGPVKIPITPRGKVRKTLRSKGKAKLKTRLTFTPAEGDPVSQTATIALRKRVRRR